MPKSFRPVCIEIKEITQGGSTYYLATSKQIEGFMAEGDTMDEVRKNSEVVMRDFLSDRVSSKGKNKTEEVTYSMKASIPLSC